MAVLTATDRQRTAAQWIRDNTSPCTFLKADVLLAVNAIDDYIDGSLTSRPTTSMAVAVQNAAPNFWTNSSTTQKYAVLAYVMRRRANQLVAQEDNA
jgi:hypothetical protein